MGAESINSSPTSLHSFHTQLLVNHSYMLSPTPPVHFNAYAFAVLVLGGLCGSDFGGFSCLLSWLHQKARAASCNLAYASSVNDKLIVDLRKTVSRRSSNLSDIAGISCRQIFPSCGKNYLTFLFTPLLPPMANELLSVVPCSTSGIC